MCSRQKNMITYNTSTKLKLKTLKENQDMNDYDRETYQDLVDKTECAFCGEVLTEYKFCSDSCAKAYWND